MRALPLWQPWATLVAVGAKRVETRGYPPHRLGLRYGERIAIHATKRETELWLCEHEWFSECLPCSAEMLPLGALIATCVLDRAREITAESAAALERRNPQEFAFGHYAPGRWAWVLRDVERLPEPIPFRGQQGAFEVPDELLALEVRQLNLGVGA